MNLKSLIAKANQSSFYRYLLNRLMNRTIPFNGPHKFRIVSITDEALVITVPYIRKNKNHIGGIHACALATLCEYTVGLTLARHFAPDAYRIILKGIHVEYHYQAQMAVTASFHLDHEDINAIKTKLISADAHFQHFLIEVFDEHKNHICTGNIHWQIKSWEKTSTGKTTH